MTQQGQKSEKIETIENLERKHKRTKETYEKQEEALQKQISALKDQRRAKRDEGRQRIGEVKDEARELVDQEEIKELKDQIHEIHNSLPYDNRLKRAVRRYLFNLFDEKMTVKDDNENKRITIRDGSIYKYNTSNTIELSDLLQDDNYWSPTKDAVKNALEEIGEENQFEKIVEAIEIIDGRIEFESHWNTPDDQTSVEEALDDAPEDSYKEYSLYDRDAVSVKVKASNYQPDISFSEGEDEDSHSIFGGYQTFETLQLIVQHKEELVSALEEHRDRAEKEIERVDPRPELFELLGDEFVDIYDEVKE